MRDIAEQDGLPGADGDAEDESVDELEEQDQQYKWQGDGLPLVFIYQRIRDDDSVNADALADEDQSE